MFISKIYFLILKKKQYNKWLRCNIDIRKIEIAACINVYRFSRAEKLSRGNS